MNVVIVGLGQVGQHIAHVLASERHDVTVIDHDKAALRAFEEREDVATLHGYGASPRILEMAGTDKADILVAVTDHDEANLVAAMAGKNMGAERTFARLQGSEFQAAEGVQYGFLGIDVVVNPLVLVAREIARIARSHGALDVRSLAGDRVEMVELELPSASKVLHKPLSALSLPEQTLITAIERDRELRIPGGTDVLLPGDRVWVVGRAQRMTEVEKLLCGGKAREAARVCLIGGGVVAQSVANALAGTGIHVLVIERDRERAEALSETFPDVEVHHADGTNLEVLQELEVGSYDLVCCVTSEDEVNLMSALLSKQVGANRTLCLVHRSDYADIYHALGIDIALSPRTEASNQILRYARQTELQSLHPIAGGKGEVMDMRVVEGSRIVGTPLQRLNFPMGAIVAAIVKGGEPTVPRGSDSIEVGDMVIVVSTKGTRPDVERMFDKRRLL